MDDRDSWWEDPSIWTTFGRSKQYQMLNSAYMGGWSGHPKQHGKNNILVFRKEGITYRSFRDLFVIPWDQVTAVEVEGPESPGSHVTATRPPTLGVFAGAAKRKARSAAVVIGLDSGETAIFLSEMMPAGEVRARLEPITTRLSPPPAAEQEEPEDPVESEDPVEPEEYPPSLGD